jgi:hypothetical protein
LPPDAVEHLVLWDAPNDETWLAPYNHLFLGGQGRFWKRVTVNRPELLAALGQDTANTNGADAASMQCGAAMGERGDTSSKSPCAREIWEAAKKVFPLPDGIPSEFGPTKLKAYLEPLLREMPSVRVPTHTGFAPKTYSRALENYPRKKRGR